MNTEPYKKPAVTALLMEIHSEALTVIIGRNNERKLLTVFFKILYDPFTVGSEVLFFNYIADLLFAERHFKRL